MPFPCEPELELEPGYGFKINPVFQRSASLVELEVIFPISTPNYQGNPGHTLGSFSLSLLLFLLWDQMTSGSIASSAFR